MLEGIDKRRLGAATLERSPNSQPSGDADLVSLKVLCLADQIRERSALHLSHYTHAM